MGLLTKLGFCLALVKGCVLSAGEVGPARGGKLGGVGRDAFAEARGRGGRGAGQWSHPLGRGGVRNGAERLLERCGSVSGCTGRF